MDRNDEIGIYSRRGNSLKQGFPEVAGAAFVHLPANTVLDAELVCWHRGRLDFGGVQRRNNVRGDKAAALAATEPCHFIAFHVLRLAGETLVDDPLSARRARLEELFSVIPAESPLALGMQTDSPIRHGSGSLPLPRWRVERIVIKPAASRYVPGNRCWDKVTRAYPVDAH